MQLCQQMITATRITTKISKETQTTGIRDKKQGAGTFVRKMNTHILKKKMWGKRKRTSITRGETKQVTISQNNGDTKDICIICTPQHH